MESTGAYEALLDICLSRKSARVFDDRPVPAELLEKIAKTARTSPYASGKRNWEIRTVTDPELLGRMAEAVERRVAELGERVRPDMKEDFLSYAKNFAFFSRAPAVFIPTFRAGRSLSLMLPGTDAGIDRWERDTSVKSISCVAMLILLAAESLGLGACYMTGALVAEKELEQLLGLPRERSIGAIIPVGYKFLDP